MSIERLTTNPASGFSDAVTAVGPGRLIHVAGNVGFGSDGTVVAGGMGAEARATFDNIERTLAAAGAQMSQVVKINAFVTSLEEYADYASARAERAGERHGAGRRPARGRADRDRRRRLRTGRMSTRITCDIGGTFTDVVVTDDD